MANEIAAAWIQAGPQWALGIAAIAGGWSALRNYKKTKRMESAEWLHRLYSGFYGSETFSDIRTKFEYRYHCEIEFVLEKTIVTPSIDLTDNDLKLICAIDNFFNYFENILFLVESDHLSRADMLAIFEFWFEFFRQDAMGAVRRYAQYGFERLSKEIGSQDKTCVFLPAHLAYRVPDSILASLGPGTTAAPTEVCFADFCTGGLFLGPSEESDTSGTLYTLTEDVAINLLQKLDGQFGFNPYNGVGGSVHRTCLRVLSSTDGGNNAALDAWTYLVRR